MIQTFSPYHMPIDDECNEWQQWKARMWNQLADGIRSHPGMAALEQWMIRSQREKRCIDCGEPCTKEHFHQSILIKCVKGYYHCPECQALYD